MPSEKKDKVVGVRLSPEYQQNLRTLSEKSQLSQSSLIRVALRRFFQEVEKDGGFTAVSK